ncbi:hypothetical protein AURDEDRAFT_188765 [Auricularia subglabra TFB-10046 SS5]|nr:hypothetical protein AURDEDRAFT_188765 [Auricularia subglabra TFB-10046 SS5]
MFPKLTGRLDTVWAAGTITPEDRQVIVDLSATLSRRAKIHHVVFDRGRKLCAELTIEASEAISKYGDPGSGRDGALLGVGNIFGIAVPFGTSLAAAAYNISNPDLSQSLSIACSCVTLVGGIVPFVVQHIRERKSHDHITTASLRTVFPEIVELRDLFSRLLATWKNLSIRLDNLAQLFYALERDLSTFVQEVNTLTLILGREQLGTRLAHVKEIV